MPPPPDDEATQIQLNVNYYITLVSFVILYYDYALTLPMEIQRFWIRGPFTWAAFFFFLNRYLAFLGHFPIILQAFWDPSDISHKFTTCRLIQSYHQYLEVAIQLVVGILLIMRVYAMYDRKKWVLWLFVVIAVSDIAVGCWGIISNAPTTVNARARIAPGCSEPLGDEQGVHLAVAWSGQLFFDAFSFLLTLRKSFTIRRSRNGGLINILLRDGAVYFAIMTAANLANILTFLLAPALSKGVTSTFVNIISATMMSRLMLNLRDPKFRDPTSRNAIKEATMTSGDPMLFTVPDPHLMPATIDEEPEEEMTSPIDCIEMIPQTKDLDPEA